MSDDLCPHCGEPHRGYACDRCDELCCEPCLEYLETHPATRIDPSDGVYVCPDCMSNIEADRAEWEIAAAEQRAEERALDREWEDRNRW